MRGFTRRRKVGAATIVAMLVLAGAAFAYWTTTGGGTGSATTGTSAAVTVTQTSTVSGLVPGSASQPVDFDITNAKTTPQYVTSVAFTITSITNITGGAPATGCTSADFTLVQPNAIAADVAAGVTHYAPSGASIAMIDAAGNQDGCKNVTVHLTFTSI
jgi:hypothetical protein